MDRISEDDPRYKWTRNINSMRGGQVTVPEATWPVLTLLKAQILPDGMRQCLLIRVVRPGPVARGGLLYYDSLVAYKEIDNLTVWATVIGTMVEKMQQQADAR